MSLLGSTTLNPVIICSSSNINKSLLVEKHSATFTKRQVSFLLNSYKGTSIMVL